MRDQFTLAASPSSEPTFGLGDLQSLAEKATGFLPTQLPGLGEDFNQRILDSFQQNDSPEKAEEVAIKLISEKFQVDQKKTRLLLNAVKEMSPESTGGLMNVVKQRDPAALQKYLVTQDGEASEVSKILAEISDSDLSEDA